MKVFKFILTTILILLFILFIATFMTIIICVIGDFDLVLVNNVVFTLKELCIIALYLNIPIQIISIIVLLI